MFNLLSQGNPILIASKDDEDIAKNHSELKIISVPSTVDGLQGVINVVPLQLMSMHIATLRTFDVRFGTHV